MKNIAIFCDGTWQQMDQRHLTNVANLARAVAARSQDGSPQVVYYDDGVGVGQGVLDTATAFLGGAFGVGLDHKIGRAYEFLCLNYEPGDRIYIFGFSRGAYTARSLAGLLRRAWILRRENANQVGAAVDLYRDRPRQGAPQSDVDAFQVRASRFRADFAFDAEAFTDGQAYDPGDPASLTPGDKRAWIQYLGVWDTVGSLGVPANLPLAGFIDRRYAFHDASLSRMVRSARHAVAIDERRNTFKPALWDNIDAQNINAGADGLAYDQRPYQQQWFPGLHGGIGGGGADGGLSRLPLLWVAQGAARAGLGLDDRQLAAYAAEADPNAVFTVAFSMAEWAKEIGGMADRPGPSAFEEVSHSARLRWAGPGAYRPAPLKSVPTVAEALDAWKAPDNPQGGLWP